MKIIISHDVDHLWATDHIKDLIVPKLLVRSAIHLLQGKISLNSYFWRICSCLPGKRWNRIPEILEFDKANNVPSTFFFGMANGLGLSYSLRKASRWVELVMKEGFDVGVHGINYTDIGVMAKEKERFSRISGLKSFGIRNHYVRYDQDTFKKMSEIGYLFDTSQFCKKNISLDDPHKIGIMWEFPLHVMDGYVLHPGKLDKAKQDIEFALESAIKQNKKFFTFLFHDYMYTAKQYPEEKSLYEWFVNHCKKLDLEFVNYRDAIKELEA